MKSKKDVLIKGHIIGVRKSGEIYQPYCIHWVKFTNDKYALIRLVSGQCLCSGDMIQRLEDKWFSNETNIRLLGFEYLEEKESARQFNAYF